MFAEAWQAVRSCGCGETRLLALANASEQSHPDEALAVYGHEVERLASLGGQPNYEAARKLITRMKSVRDTRGQTADHDAFLADFVGRHKARRNLIKILQVDVIGRSQQRVRVEP
jgi:ribosomal protein L20A (L18A)